MLSSRENMQGCYNLQPLIEIKQNYVNLKSYRYIVNICNNNINNVMINTCIIIIGIILKLITTR